MQDRLAMKSRLMNGDDVELGNRKVMITGATGGIGQHLTTALAGAGARVAVTGRDVRTLEELDALEQVVLARPADVTVESQIADFVVTADEALGGVDVLITLTGRSIPGPVDQMTVEDFDAIMAPTVRGTFLACKHALGVMGEGGLIVNVGSMAGVRANGGAPLYCTAKAATVMFSEALGMQVADRGIRVSTVNPGGVDTGFWGDRPVNRAAMLSPADVTEAIMFLIGLPPHVIVRDLRFESTGAPR